MPARGQWACLALAISDDCERDCLGVIEDSAECVRERVAELTTLVDASNDLLL